MVFTACTLLQVPALADTQVQLSGILKPSVVVSTGVESYQQPNSSAITAPVNPLMVADPARLGTSFQAQQSRLRADVAVGADVSGRLEVDFIDFRKSSPTTGVNPRLRIAMVRYTPWRDGDSQLALELGQDWDLFAPLNPHTLNLVGAFFQSGNVGFMRQQARAVWTLPGVELAAALGAAAPNHEYRWAGVEHATSPAFALRLAHRSASVFAAVSAMVADMRVTVEERRAVGVGASASIQWSPTPALELRAEAYAGRATGAMGLLGTSEPYLEAGRLMVPADAGGFVSAKLEQGRFGASVAAGTMRELGSVVPPGYTRSADGAVTRTRLGLVDNTQLRAAAFVRLGAERKLQLFVEPFWLNGRHALRPEDAARGERRTAVGVETGALLVF